jgi:hypothetical protein
MPTEHTFLIDLPDVLREMGFNVEVANGYEYGQGDYLWTNPHDGRGSYHGQPWGYMVHHTATSAATPPKSTDSKAGAWIGLWRDGRLYQSGGGVPTIYLASAGPARISSGYGYRPALWNHTFKEERAPAKAQGSDGDTAGNRYTFNVETVAKGDGSPIDPRVLDAVVGLGVALEMMTELKEMTLGHLSWSQRKIDPYWNNDRDCITTVQQRVAEGIGGPVPKFVERREILVEPKTHTTLTTLVAPDAANQLYKGYTRVPPSDAEQFITRFATDPDSDDMKHSGSNDRALTPGKDFIRDMWFLKAQAGQEVGLQFWHDASEAILVEYSSLERM